MRMRPCRTLSVLALAFGLLQPTAGRGADDAPSSAAEQSPSRASAAKKKAGLNAPASSPAREARTSDDDAAANRPDSANYVLQPKDVIRIFVFDEPDLNAEIAVSPDGTINLPLLGPVDLTGKTVRETQETLRQLYDKDYVVNPRLTVTLVKGRADKETFVKVFGSVGKPGMIPFDSVDGLMLSDAIMKAGDFTRLADRKRITITRPVPNGEPKVFKVNATNLLRGDASEDVQLEPNDIIDVPERMF